MPWYLRAINEHLFLRHQPPQKSFSVTILFLMKNPGFKDTLSAEDASNCSQTGEPYLRGKKEALLLRTIPINGETHPEHETNATSYIFKSSLCDDIPYRLR